MALRVKDVGVSAQKWSNNAGNASNEYSTNAQAASGDWEKNTVAAADNYHAAVSNANTKERFRRGVQKAGAGKYASKIAAVGANRFTEGVQGAQADWQAGFEPYAQVLQGLTLSARRPRGDAGNISRVREVAQALHAKRLAGIG